MTLIVGVLCDGGVVVGADGAATLGGLGGTTARQPVRKLTSIGERVILGVSGPVGMSQLFTDRIDSLGTKLAGTHCKTAADAMRVISEEFKKDVLPAFAGAQAAAGVVGIQAAQNSVLTSSLVALHVGRQPTLIQFDHQCAPEAASPDLPFVAVGIGQQTADPFLAMLRRVFWRDRLPNVAEGIFATVWTLHQAIETSPGGVAKPIQVMVLDSGGVVDELDEVRLEQHEQEVKSVEVHLGNYKREREDATPGSEDVSSPPVPASS